MKYSSAPIYAAGGLGRPGRAGLAVLPLLLLALGARAQTTLQTESFETDGEGSRYVSTSFLPGSADGSIIGTRTNDAYFLRATETSSTQTIGSANWPRIPVSGGALAGTYFWAGEGVRGPEPNTNIRVDRPPGYVQLNAVSVAGYRSLQVKVAFLDARYNGFNWEHNDTMKVQVRFGAGSPWLTVGQFVGDDSDDNTDLGSGYMRQDTNLNGISSDAADASSPFWNAGMVDYTFNVPATGSTLQARVVASQSGLNEEFGFDNIRVLGTAYSSAAPVLAAIESSTLGYPTANAQVALTNTLTVSDADNTTLSSALVRFAEIKDATNDVLSFAGTAATGNITGTFNASTRTLALASVGNTATLTQWQEALRLVKFQTTTAFSSSTNRDRTVLLVVTDPSGNASNAAFRRVGYAVAPANSAPTALALSNSSVAENAGANATVGTFSTTDPDAGNTFTYTLVSGTGSTDNGSFSISGNTLYLTASADYETKSSYAIRVRTADQGGLSFEQAFTIGITNVNEAPGIGAQSRSVAENSANGTAVGAALTATDPDAGTMLTYSIVGGNSGGAFAIDGSTGQLTVAGALDYETTSSYTLTVQVSDGSLTSSATITVGVTDVNELTASITAQTNVLCNGSSTGAATVTASGEPGPYTYSWSPRGGSSATATSLAAGTYTVTVSRPAAPGHSATAQVTISEPTALAASSSQTNVSVNGGSDGTATVAVSGGTLNYAYSWSTMPAQTSATATGLSAGTYTVTITDANGCQVARSFTITQPAATALTTSGGTVASPTSIPAGTYSSLTVPAGSVAQLGGGVVVNGPVLVSGTLLTACQTLTGSGSFTLAAGATLYVCDAAGLSLTGSTGAVQVTGTRTFASDANYIYNGTAAQVTGAGLPATVRSLTVDKASGISLSLTQALAIRQTLTMAGAGNLSTNSQALTLLSDATGTALLANLGTGQVSGSLTMERYIDGTLNMGMGYRHLGPTTQGATVADLGSGGTAPVVNAAYNTATQPNLTTPFPTVFRYDQARLATSPATNLSVFDKGWLSPASPSEVLSPIAGLTVQLPAGQTLRFTGATVQGTVSTTILRRTTGATAAEGGWAFVANPYAAPLDWSTFAASQLNNLDASMYVYESTSQYGGQYRSYVNGIGNPLIGSSQAFWVRVSQGQTQGQLRFTNANRVSDYSRQQVVRRGTADPRPQLQLALAGAGLSDALQVYAETGATAALDARFDAAKLSNSTGLNLASLSAGGEQLAIDGRADFATATSIPLFVGVPALGRYTLTAASLANLPAGTRAELVDNLTGTRTALMAGASYAFTMTAFTAPGRFWLNLTPAAAPLATATALEAQVLAYPNPAHGSITVLRPAAKVATATLLNSLGQTVRTLALPTAETSVSLTGLATGVYTLRLTLDGQPVIKRVVVE